MARSSVQQTNLFGCDGWIRMYLQNNSIFHSEAHITCTYGTSCTITRLCKHIHTTTNHLYGCRTIKCTHRVSALVDGRKNTSPSFSGSDHIRNIQLMAEQLNSGCILTLVCMSAFLWGYCYIYVRIQCKLQYLSTTNIKCINNLTV